MSVVVDNRNRLHAIEQLKKGLKNKDNLDEGVEELRMLAAIANSLIYVGDTIKDLSNSMKEEEYYKDYINDEEESKK